MTTYALSIQKPEIGPLLLLLCLKKFAGRLLHINTGNALRRFDVCRLLPLLQSIFIPKQKQYTHGTVTFPPIARFSFIVACYLGTTFCTERWLGHPVGANQFSQGEATFFLPLFALPIA